MIDGLVDRKMEFRFIYGRDLRKITFPHDSFNGKNILIGIDTQLCSQHPAVTRRHARSDLQPDNLGKFTIA